MRWRATRRGGDGNRSTTKSDSGTTSSTKLLVGELVDSTSAPASRMTFLLLALALVRTARHCVPQLDGKSFGEP